MFTPSTWLVPHRREDSAAEEYLEHPDFRAICAFFLGWLFMGSLYHIVCSVFFRDLYHRSSSFLHLLVKSTVHVRPSDLEAPPHITTVGEKTMTWVKGDETSSIRRRYDRSALVFTLNLCFLSAGLSQFITLLTFRGKAGWDTGCAFAVAWGGVTSQVACLIASCILCLELGRNNAQRSELFAVWIGLFVALVLVFVVNALSTGTTSFVDPLATYVCNRGHYLPVSLTSSLVQLAVDIYVAVRLVMLQLPFTPRTSDIYAAIRSPTIGQALSVIVLNLLTIVPNAVRINVIAQFVPFSVGGLLVLVAFNYHPAVAKLPLVQPTPSPTFTISMPPPHTRRVDTRDSYAHDPYGLGPLDRAPAQNTRRSLQISVFSDHSFDSDVIGSVENAIISTAIRHTAMESRQSLAIPQSAPPRMEGWPVGPPGLKDNHILPFQVEFAEQMEREDRERSQAHGPVVRPAERNRKLRILIYEDEDGLEGPEASTLQTSASVIGSDIIYTSPTRTRIPAAEARNSLAPSIQRSGTFGFSPRTSRMTVRTYYRDSYIATQDILSEYYLDSRPFSVAPHRTSRANSTRSPRHSSIKHFSFSSQRQKGRDEVPTAPESRKNEVTAAAARTSLHRSRRTTFGQPIISPSRRPSTTQSPWDAVPPLPTHLSTHSFPRPSPDSLSPISPLRIHKTWSSHAPPLPSLPADLTLRVPLSRNSVDPENTVHNMVSFAKVKGPRPLPSAFIPESVGSKDGAEMFNSP